MLDQYERYKRVIRDERLPVALVDLDAVDHNIETLLADVRQHGKTLRLASKSVRCPWLLKYITEKGQGVIRGILSYSVTEAAFLVEQGFTDIIVAYPTVQPVDCQLLAQLNSRDCRVAIVVDSEAHLQALRGTPERPIPVVIEIDLSYRPLGRRVHLGARRSPLRTPEAVLELARKIMQRRDLKLLGLMGYEAQIAGVGENNPFSPLLNPARKLIKKLSRPYVAQMRQRVLELLRREGFSVEVFNGGGTGLSLIHI